MTLVPTLGSIVAVDCRVRFTGPANTCQQGTVDSDEDPATPCVFDPGGYTALQRAIPPGSKTLSLSRVAALRSAAIPIPTC